MHATTYDNSCLPPFDPLEAWMSIDPLQTLRHALHRDYLTSADWQGAIVELALLTREALGADEAFVALSAESRGTWTAHTSDGDIVEEADISFVGSRTVLEEVRQSQKPVRTTVQMPLAIDSRSLLAHGVEAVLAVPIRIWEADLTQSKRRFIGCLYAHRASKVGAFSEADVALVMDLAQLAQRNLSLIQKLNSLKEQLSNVQHEVKDLRGLLLPETQLGTLSTRDADFERKVLAPLRRAAEVERVGILILGPTGSGKSHLASAFHCVSKRSDGPFVVLDCSQVTSETTLSAELFGYAPNSGYANAPKEGRKGKASLAHRGTLFIDEVAALPFALQRQLLRVLQEGRFSPLGSSEEKAVDTQVIAATNEDLEGMVAKGLFREDLYWRLGEIMVTLPPLSERKGDITLLAQSMFDRAKLRYGRKTLRGLADSALSALTEANWAENGNFRGLERAISRAVILARDDAESIEVKDLPEWVLKGSERSVSEGEHVHTSPLVASEDTELKVLMNKKIIEHGGRLQSLGTDPVLKACLGYKEGAIPKSTLTQLIRRLGLSVAAEQARKSLTPSLEEIGHALSKHRTATAAARALGISRDSLIYQLRREGLGVRDMLLRIGRG